MDDQTHLRRTIESIFPGYGSIIGIILQYQHLRLMVLIVVTSYATLRLLKGLDIDYLFASVHIDDGHDLFPALLNWASKQFAGSMTLKASAIRMSPLENDDETLEVLFAGRNIGLATFEPFYGKRFFLQNGRLFYFQRTRKLNNNFFQQGNDEYIIMGVLGFSTTPIKELLKKIKASELERERLLTNIWIPKSKVARRFQSPWKKELSISARSSDTITLNELEKDALIHDIEQYLQPASARWYKERGIPLRRGYLFYGPPGTGKTSLALSVAAHFHLDIYIVSLEDPEAEDLDLITYFANLPPRSILLLEDIDAISLNLDHRALQNDKKRETKFSEERSSCISLSGLLNAIDGIISSEGHILIMTTNHMDKLDSALIRPGRIDFQVKFTLAKENQLRDMFIRIYGKEKPGIEVLADRFAAGVPQDMFSPAEVQSFLMLHRDDPRKAVDAVGSWIKKLKADKNE